MLPLFKEARIDNMQTVNKYILQTTQETKISNKKEDITVLRHHAVNTKLFFCKAMLFDRNAMKC